MRIYGIDNSPVNFDIRVGGSGPRLLEINPGRVGGNLLSYLTRDATGISLEQLVVAIYAKTDLPRIESRPADSRIVRMRFMAPQVGVVRHLDTSALEKHPNIHRLMHTAAPGDRVGAHSSIAYAFASFPMTVNRPQLADIYQWATSVMKVDLRAQRGKRLSPRRSGSPLNPEVWGTTRAARELHF